MNNNKKILSVIFIAFMYNNAHAVNEQLLASQNYLLENNVNVEESNNKELSSNALAPKGEIRIQNKNELLKSLQVQIALEPTGIMDEPTTQYIQTFQEENNFNVTKTLDYNTWFALFEQNQLWKNNTVQKSEKIWQEILEKQTVANTEKFIIVNIPTMTLTAYEWDGQSSKEVLSSKVVVGKSGTETPLRDFNVTSLKYNPTWTPTDGMLKRGAYRNGNLDMGWVRSHGLRILDSNNRVVSPNNIVSGVKYRFQQPAGDRNALGILKFETDSTQNIYLHDTNEKKYFLHNTRAYSSGCIRVQDFKEVANWLKNADDVEEKLKRKDTYFEKIDKTPVYITYSQVMFYENTPLFAPDIYNRNKNTQFKK